MEKFYAIIVGCGRLGSHLANSLSKIGHSIVVIDVNYSAFNHLTTEYSGFKIEGDATELEILKKAKLNQADLFIAATKEDNINLMVAQIAKKIFNVPIVLARVFDPTREKIFENLGIETICPTSISVSRFLEILAENNTKNKA